LSLALVALPKVRRKAALEATKPTLELTRSLLRRGNTAVKGSRDNVAIYLEAADFASAPVGYKRYCDFRLGVVTQKVRMLRRAVWRVAPRRVVYERRARVGGCRRVGAPNSLCPPLRHVRAQPADGGVDKSAWRSGAHEFNSETSDGTWGFSQVRRAAELGGSSFQQTTHAFRGIAYPRCRLLLLRRRLMGWIYRGESTMLSPWLAKAAQLCKPSRTRETLTPHSAHAADSPAPPGPDVNAVHHRRELVQHAGLDCG